MKLESISDPLSMTDQNKNPRRIKILRDLDSQRLAAGEVIERPVSVLRELLDNAVDAKSSQIDIHLSQGGLESIRVIDNGIGIEKEDLSLALLPHATSKISAIEDLSRITTLGFRGEALASIAVCANIEITSLSDPKLGAYSIAADNGEIGETIRGRGKKGTSVHVSRLFYTMPARKKFLKRPQTENFLCKEQVIEKALPFPEITFRLFTEGNLKLFLPKAELPERIRAEYPTLFPSGSLLDFSGASDLTLVRAICSPPGFFRRDRKYIQIFVNNRRIKDFALLQAVEYGYSQALPGGAFPYAFVFIQIPPDQVDFNIHPAKKEVKFQNPPQIHHFLTSLFRENLKKSGGFSFPDPKPLRSSPAFQFPTSTMHEPSPVFLRTAQSSIASFSKTENKPETAETSFKYLGQAFNLFLIAERDDEVHFIDQHAAHERLLFNDLKANGSKSQKLLFPIPFHLEPDSIELFQNKISRFQSLGITIKQISETEWELLTIPHLWKASPGNLLEMITEDIKNSDDLETELFAQIACKNAIKEGEIIDTTTAHELIAFAFTLEDPRCPHGRSILWTINREELYKKVGRILF